MDYLLPEQSRRDEDAATNPASSIPSFSTDRSIPDPSAARQYSAVRRLGAAISRDQHRRRHHHQQQQQYQHQSDIETASRAYCRSSIPASRLYRSIRVAYVYRLPIHGQSWRRRNRSEQYSLPAYSSSPEPAHIIRTRIKAVASGVFCVLIKCTKIITYN